MCSYVKVWTSLWAFCFTTSALASAIGQPIAIETEPGLEDAAKHLPAHRPGTVHLWIINDEGSTSDILNVRMRLFSEGNPSFQDYSVVKRVKRGDQYNADLPTRPYFQGYVTWEEVIASRRVYRYGRIFKHNAQYIKVEKGLEELDTRGRKYEQISVVAFDLPRSR